VGSIELTATLVARGAAAAIALDDEQAAAIGEGTKRFPVRATVNGSSWRTTVAPMGRNVARLEPSGTRAGWRAGGGHRRSDDQVREGKTLR
jgi:hypothetical protein